MKRDYLRIVEAMYAPGSVESWLQGIVDAAEPILGLGLGVAAYTFAVEGEGFTFDAFAEAPSATGSLRTVAGECFAADPNNAAWAHRHPPRVEAASEFRTSLPDAPMYAAMARGGMQDALAVKAHELEHLGCVMVVPSPSCVQLGSRTRGALNRVAAHFGAALRLRQHELDPLTEADAIVDSRGTLAHLAAGTDRRTLEDAIELRAHRVRLRREAPDRALELWEALVAGRWSLVDHVDRDGKRFVLARRNPPHWRDPKALTSNERAVAIHTVRGMTNKAIAYELGLAPSTVSGLLKMSMRKLRVRTRTELSQLLAGPARLGEQLGEAEGDRARVGDAPDE